MQPAGSCVRCYLCPVLSGVSLGVSVLSRSCVCSLCPGVLRPAFRRRDTQVPSHSEVWPIGHPGLQGPWAPEAGFSADQQLQARVWLAYCRSNRPSAL
eukprot:12434967-Alexandrium_andersonii.AAC.1